MTDEDFERRLAEFTARVAPGLVFIVPGEVPCTACHQRFPSSVFAAVERGRKNLGGPPVVVEQGVGLCPRCREARR